jgi:IS5 family transposase
MQEKYGKLNNDNLPKVAYDKQARIGCKGKDKFWYGYTACKCGYGVWND